MPCRICPKPATHRGLCNRHYLRARGPYGTGPDLERLTSEQLAVVANPPETEPTPNDLESP